MSIPIFGDESNLPRELAGHTFGGLQRYDDPRMGVSLRYDDTDTKVDVYLYDLGLKDIPDDLRSPQVMSFFRDAASGPQLMAQRGDYLDLQVLATQYLHVPPEAPEPICLHAAFSYRQALGPHNSYTGTRVSHLALRIDRGFINKIRYTFHAERGGDGTDGFMRFLAAWLEAINKQPQA